MKPVFPMMMWTTVAMTPAMNSAKPFSKPSSAKYMTVTRPRPVDTMVTTAMCVLSARPATRKSEMPLIADAGQGAGDDGTAHVDKNDGQIDPTQMELHDTPFPLAMQSATRPTGVAERTI